MNIDERLEALTQAVELLASMHQDHEQNFEERQKQIDQMFQSMATQFSERIQSIEALFARRDEQFNERFQANETRLAQLMDTMNRLGRILEVHDQTIDEHERRLDDLDKPRH